MKESGIDWIGQIPEEWEVAKVNHIFEEHKQKNRGNKEKNLLSLSYGRIIRKSIDSSFGLLPESFETYNIIQRGDIVLRLTDLQNDKRSLRVGLARENGIITSAYLTLRLKNLESNDSYMYYLLHTYDICKVFYNFGGGVRQGGTWSDIYKMELLIPPCNEQQKIADFLDKKTAQLDKAKALLEEQIRKLKDYRASLIYETVTKGLDKTVPLKDSGIDWIGQVPEGWGVTKIKNIVNIERGASPRPIDKFISDDGTGVNWIRIGDTHKGIKYITSTKLKITNRGKQYSRYIHPGTLILSNSMSFGEPYISSIYGCIHDGWLSLAPFNNISKEYLYWLLLSDVCTSQFNLVSIGAVVENLSVDKVGNTLIPMPYSLSEQTKISDFLDKKTVQIDQLIQFKNKQIDNINKQRQTLIYDYVTGKRRV